MRPINEILILYLAPDERVSYQCPTSSIRRNDNRSWAVEDSCPATIGIVTITLTFLASTDRNAIV